MMHYAYGRNPAVHTRKSMRSALLMATTLDALGPPPSASNNYTSAVKVDWGMLDNDTLGDCVCADTAHTLMLRTANASQIVVPNVLQVVALYGAVGGYVINKPETDNGCSEAAMCQYMVTTGFLGHKASAVGMVEPSDLDHVKWCIQLFGSCRIGLNLPGYAEDQFNSGLAWDVSASGQQYTDGHDVPLVDYRDGVFTCVTWGKAQTVTPAFLNKYCDEAHVELFGDWIRAQGEAPSGFDLTDLTTKMTAISMS